MGKPLADRHKSRLIINMGLVRNQIKKQTKKNYKPNRKRQPAEERTKENNKKNKILKTIGMNLMSVWTTDHFQNFSQKKKRGKKMEKELWTEKWNKKERGSKWTNEKKTNNDYDDNNNNVIRKHVGTEWNSFFG